MTDEPTNEPTNEPTRDASGQTAAPDERAALRPGSDRALPGQATRLISTLLDAVTAAVTITVLDVLLIALVVRPAKGHKLSPGQGMAVILVSALLGAGLFILLEHAGGSVGRRLVHTRLVQLDRTLPGWGPLLVRYLAIFVPLINPLGLLLVVCALLVEAFQPERRNVFDLLTRLRVVPRDAVIGSPR